jgi:Xaa-Pro aminopeptidase
MNSEGQPMNISHRRLRRILSRSFGLLPALGCMAVLAATIACRGSSNPPTPGEPSGQAAAVADEAPIPGLRDRAALYNGWLKDRFERVLPAVMRREKTDMWIVVCREHAEDPVYPTLMPCPNMFAWRLSMLVFFDRSGTVGVERLSVNPYGSGAFNKEIGDYYAPGWTDRNEDPWARLARIVRERDPNRIAIDESKIFAFADGLSATLKAELVAALGSEFAGRLVSAERLAVGWLEKRTAAELDFFAKLAAVNRGVAAEALSAKVIKPGLTTLNDLSWWTRERFAALGVEAWFQPTFYILRRTDASPEEAKRNVILPGDIVRCDIGFRCLGMTTDMQEVAYVLREGETEAPKGMREAMKLGNRLQDILIAEFKEGRTGNECLAAALSKARAEGLKPRIYSHPLNYYGHGAGTRIGPGEGAPGMGDYPLYSDTCWAVELGVDAVIPEWADQAIFLALEQSAVFTAKGVFFSAGRQTEFHLVNGVPAK